MNWYKKSIDIGLHEQNFDSGENPEKVLNDFYVNIFKEFVDTLFVSNKNI